MGDVLSQMAVVLVAGWVLLGPAILIALSHRVRGAKKVTWAIVAAAPIPLAILGVVLAIHAYPDSPLHIHSNHLPAAFFLSTAAAWVVYIAFRRRYVPDPAPNNTL